MYFGNNKRSLAMAAKQGALWVTSEGLNKCKRTEAAMLRTEREADS